MAFSYGFYNSLNGDRKYDSEDLSRMFDGIIYDGVIGAVGDTFAVKAGTGNTVNVSSGRAWFDHTWTYNDAPMPISCGSAAVLLDRYDAIVLEVNAASDMRKNSIKVVTGTEASNPVKPTMENTEFVHQYPLAYILRKAGSSSISQSQIENAVGTSECPICTGVLKSLNIDQQMAQWNAQFNEWFEDTKGTLSGDVAGNLLNKITETEKKIPYVYSGTFSVSGWTASAYSDGVTDYPYKQSIAVKPEKSSAPNVTASSTFMSGCGFTPTKVAKTDETLTEALGIINDGVTVSSYQHVTTYVKEKPTCDITVRWEIAE